MERGSKPKGDGVRKRRPSQRRGRKKSKTTARLPSKVLAYTESSVSSQANILPASEPVLEQYTASKPLLEQDPASMPVPSQNTTFMPALEQEAAFEPAQGQDTASVDQFKALIKQNADLAALLEESKRKFDVITKNAERAKKNYISLRKANNRKYEALKEELKLMLDEQSAKIHAGCKEVGDLNAAIYFVLERGHEGKFFDKMWSKTREWTRYQ
ncbi:hypothetical protein QBC45DRAFT_470308 [Copromyces sp. CBS 386.78]|nr:hypothetical protein QBC45DRAFT_470308 [Copromyces sp. CBS 386.78]